MLVTKSLVGYKGNDQHQFNSYLIPVLDVPVWLWVCIGIIAAIKSINLVSGFIVQKKFVAEHTVMNKVTGVLLFLLPLTLKFIELKYSAISVCAIATFAAIQEGYYIRTKKTTERTDT